MKLNLKTEIEKLVKKYQGEVTEALNKVKELETSQRYTADAKGQMIRDIKTMLQKADSIYNTQLNVIILDVKKEVEKATVNKPDDYQNMLNNALNQLNMIGYKLTDKLAYDIVKPFFGDFETMHNLHSVISNTPNKDGLNLTTMTVGWLDKMVYRIESLARGTKYFFNSGTYMAIGLNFAIGSDVLLGEAGEIDLMGVKMDELIKFTFEEAEENIEESMKEKMLNQDE